MTCGVVVMELKKFIRDVPDFPEPGILYRDITPLLGNPEAFGYVIDSLMERFKSVPIDSIVAIEARGFLFGAPLAHKMGKPMVPVRKPGKLPAATYATDYALEYGNNSVELHVDAFEEGARVLILDDLLATGGTLAASARLVEMAGGVVCGIAVVIELNDLNGRRELENYDVFSLVQYKAIAGTGGIGQAAASP